MLSLTAPDSLPIGFDTDTDGAALIVPEITGVRRDVPHRRRNRPLSSDRSARPGARRAGQGVVPDRGRFRYPRSGVRLSVETDPEAERPMRYQTLGPTGVLVSELCLGTMTFGDGWGFGGIDVPAATRLRSEEHR